MKILTKSHKRLITIDEYFQVQIEQKIKDHNDQLDSFNSYKKVF